MPDLASKQGIVFGIANKRSIAWAIAQAAHEAGARLAVTYQNDRLKDNVQSLAASLRDPLVLPCDVGNDAELDRVFQQVHESFGSLDFVVHSVAFAPREAMEGTYLDTTREAFRIALDVSAYSLTAIAKRALPLMEGRAGSIVTLTYLGADKVVPHYNVMGVAKAALEASVRYLASDLGPKGVRVNAISAGPIKTLAAAGISDFSSILDHFRERAALRRNTESSEVANTAVFLLSDLGRGITGEVLFVDNGYHIMGV
ncbi:MAG: enoyl-ACP reductase [Planctomycetota bacterium]